MIIIVIIVPGTTLYDKCKGILKEISRQCTQVVRKYFTDVTQELIKLFANLRILLQN